jgi:hypothetical protein
MLESALKAQTVSELLHCLTLPAAIGTPVLLPGPGASPSLQRDHLRARDGPFGVAIQGLKVLLSCVKPNAPPTTSHSVAVNFRREASTPQKLSEGPGAVARCVQVPSACRLQSR